MAKALADHLHEMAKKAIQHPPIRMKYLDRNYLPKLCAEFGLTYGAEVGVERGLFSKVFCETIPKIELLLVDTWAVGEDMMSKEVGQALADRRYRQAQRRLKGYNVKFLKGKSMDMVRDIPYESLDFVYIDAAHDFDNVVMDIVEWTKRVRKGGLIAGHDYYKFREAGVIEAVDAYIKCHRLRDVFLTNEISPSWFFSKNWTS